MFQSEADLKEAGCSPEEIKKIRQQHTGGISNARGTQYEDVYAIWRLLKAMKVYLETGMDASVQRQGLCPIDDLIYEDATSAEFCQLKTSSSITWTADDSKLTEQFLLQQRMCERSPKRKPYTLRLVSPDENRKGLLEASIPEALTSSTEVQLFEDSGSLTKVWMDGGSCYQLLRDLCAYKADSPSHRETIFFAFYAALQKTPLKEPCSLASVIEEVESRKQSAALHLRDFDMPTQWPRVQSIVSRINHLTVDISGGICHYRYENGFVDEGDIGRTGTARLEHFLDRVIKDEPATFEDFEFLL